jgi:hypothetical protein
VARKIVDPFSSASGNVHRRHPARAVRRLCHAVEATGCKSQLVIIEGGILRYATTLLAVNVC